MSRYLYVDHMLTAVQASPRNKVATLSSDSLELMASARNELHSMGVSQVSKTWSFVKFTTVSSSQQLHWTSAHVN